MMAKNTMQTEPVVAALVNPPQQLSVEGSAAETGVAPAEAAEDKPQNGALARVEVAHVDAPVAASAGSEGRGAPPSDRATHEPARRWATVASPIEHSGERFEIDDPVVLSEAEFGALKGTGAVVEGHWDDLLEE